MTRPCSPSRPATHPAARRVRAGRAAGALVELRLLPMLLLPMLIAPAAGITAAATPAGGVGPVRADARTTVVAAAETGTNVLRAAGVWPLEPEPVVVARFDPPATRYASGHRGVDLAGTAGQVVRSALPGRVVFAGLVAGRGVVVVGHGVTRTTYEPVAASVPVGTEVLAGQPIGTLEAFGSHCGPQACLHWGLLEGERYRDPLTLVGAGPVRLLPLLPLAGRTPSGSPVAGEVAGGAAVALRPV